MASLKMAGALPLFNSLYHSPSPLGWARQTARGFAPEIRQNDSVLEDWHTFADEKRDGRPRPPEAFSQTGETAIPRSVFPKETGRMSCPFAVSAWQSNSLQIRLRNETYLR